tara:strand:- start:2363 stop:2548 length:186 start_codon:yes stop_codon:yes gene_type:complete
MARSLRIGSNVNRIEREQMKLDRIFYEIKMFLIEAVKLAMLCLILYMVIVLMYAYFDVPMY